MFKTGILTMSDKGARGEREDKTGPAIQKMLEGQGYTVEYYAMIPDDQSLIQTELIKLCDELQLDLILTNGGTGFSVRDVTPEATKQVVEREVPGIPEYMRLKSFAITERAMLSRAFAGIRGKTLIINLPGSPKAAAENLQTILPSLAHGLEILIGTAGECAR